MAIEREQPREFFRILMLQQEERDVQKEQDVNRSKVLAAASEHDSTYDDIIHRLEAKDLSVC